MKLRTFFPTFRNISSLGMICGWASENQIGPADFRRLLARGPVPKILMWQPVNNRPLCLLISVILCNLNCPLSTESAPRPSAQSSSAPPPPTTRTTKLTKVAYSPYYRGVRLWDRLNESTQKATTKVKFKQLIA